jgi:hypothetical protein
LQTVLLFGLLNFVVLALTFCGSSCGIMSAGDSCDGWTFLMNRLFAALLAVVFFLERLPVAWWAESPD